MQYLNNAHYSDKIKCFVLQMSKYLGKFCEHHKLCSETLLSSRPLKPVKIVKNRLIIELVRLRSIHRLPWRSVVDKVIQLHGKRWPCGGPTELTMIKTLSTTYKKYRNLVLKRNTSAINELENTTFSIPVSQVSFPLVEVCHSLPKRKSILRKEHESALKSTISELCTELKVVSAEVVDLKKAMSKTTKVTHLYNISKREKRKVKRLQMQEDVISQLRNENEAKTRIVCKLERNKEKMKLKLQKCRRQNRKTEIRYKSRIRRLLKAQKPVYTDSDDSTEAKIAGDEEKMTTIRHLTKVYTTQRSANAACNY